MAPNRSPTRPVAGGSGLAGMNRELENLQQDYNNSYASLFPEVASGLAPAAPSNPFVEDTPSEPNPSGDDSTAGEANQPPGEGAPDDASDSNPPPEPEPDPAPDSNPDAGSETGGGGSDPPPDSTPPEPEPPSSFNFVIVSNLDQQGGRLVSRANLQDNVFVFESGYQLDFSPAILRSVLGFEQGDLLLTTDFDGDGLTDFISGRVVTGVGSVIESYRQVSPGRFEFQASTVLYLRAVRSFTLFDVTRDGQPEMLLLLDQDPNLWVYTREGENWNYLRELSLPIDPGLLLATSTGPGLGDRYLYVIDPDFELAVRMSRNDPSRFHFALQVPLNGFRITQVDWQGAEERPLAVFVLHDRILLAEQGLFGPMMVGSFDLRAGVPFLVLGDYLRSGSRQTLWVP